MSIGTTTGFACSRRTSLSGAGGLACLQPLLLLSKRWDHPTAARSSCCAAPRCWLQVVRLERLHELFQELWRLPQIFVEIFKGSQNLHILREFVKECRQDGSTTCHWTCVCVCAGGKKSRLREQNFQLRGSCERCTVRRSIVLQGLKKHIIQ